MIFFPVVNLSPYDEGNSRRSTETEESGSPGWRSSISLPSVTFSSRGDGCDSPLKRIQNSVSRVLKGFSQPSDKKCLAYNPEVLTKQKRQWASFQLQSLRSFKEPSKLFETMVVVGLHPSFDVRTLGRQLIAWKNDVSEKVLFSLDHKNRSCIEPALEPQVLFAYPPEKQLPLKYKDLLSFCFPGGVEIHAVERSPSMSDLNEILLGQEHLKHSDLSFVFRLQVADNSTLYGCCVLVEELVDKPSRLISMISDSQPVSSCLGRYVFTTRRCYCIISRLPFFELHFGILNSIFLEERLERLTKSISVLDLGAPDPVSRVEGLEENGTIMSLKHASEDEMYESVITSQSSFGEATTSRMTDTGSVIIHSDIEGSSSSFRDDTDDSLTTASYERDTPMSEKEAAVTQLNSEASDLEIENSSISKPTMEKCIPGAVWPLLWCHKHDGSEPSSSLQGSPCEDRYFRSDNDQVDTEEPSISDQDDYSRHNDILEWAKANNHGSLQIICEYEKLTLPPRGSKITFHPLEHLHPLEFRRLGERVLHISGSSLDIRSCSTKLETIEAQNALMVEEEAIALSAWTVSCLCGSLRLEHVLTLFAGALLEKQIVFVCSNLGILSASVLSLIPVIRPYQWQSLLMPVLPNDMLDFLDAPVPYIVGVQSKRSDVQSKLTNAIVVDISKNQVKSTSMPQLPKQKELLTSLAPYHSKLVGESYLGRKRPMYECTDVQVEAAKGLLEVLRNYLDSLCCNLRSHTITNVQSNADKVSLLLRESFIDSFPNRDRPFMKLFVDTQLFSVHTDLALSLYQKD